jgi:hypothetical protein
MSKDYRDGYKDGFKDGYEEGKRHAPVVAPPISFPPVLGNPPSGCTVCGRNYNRIDMYVCPRSDCPTKIWATGIPTINAKASVSGTASGIVANNSWVAINGGEWSAAQALDAEQQNPTYMRTDGWANK